MPRKRIRENLQRLQDQIGSAARRAGREADTVTLVAVTKRNPAEWIRPVVEFGIHDLGENYPQELWTKAEQLSDLSVRWHLIGHLQGNKAKKTLPLVTMIHSVDSLKLLRQLDDQAPDPAAGAAPSVCLQVNTSGEAAKHGWSPEQLLAEAEAIAGCRRIPVVGLMTMAALGSSAETARPSFRALRELRDSLHTRTGLALEQLSMGMSSDFEAAVEEGATLVRIGSAIFEGAAR